jgi:hypothetical protein
MNHAKTSFSTEMFAGAIISVVQYLAPLWYPEGHRPWIPAACVKKTSAAQAGGEAEEGNRRREDNIRNIGNGSLPKQVDNVYIDHV